MSHLVGVFLESGLTPLFLSLWGSPVDRREGQPWRLSASWSQAFGPTAGVGFILKRGAWATLVVVPTEVISPARLSTWPP